MSSMNFERIDRHGQVEIGDGHLSSAETFEQLELDHQVEAVACHQ